MGEMAEDALDRAYSSDRGLSEGFKQRKKKQECFICGETDCLGHGLED